MVLSSRLGSAVAAGVPVLVLVSLGPVAGLAGSASLVIWPISAVVGLLMALAFIELAAAFPHQTGGIGVLSARVWTPHSRVLAQIGQWSYWFGWSPALAINGVLVGGYLRDVVWPGAPAWTSLVAATGVLAASVTVNHYGMLRGARLQAALTALVAAGVLALLVGVLAGGRFHWSNLSPIAPPAGWLSGSGVIALAGGLFIAGWSAYGAELALSYGTEYRDGRQAADTVALVGLASVVAYAVVPLVLLGALGVPALQDDPAIALAAVVPGSHSWAGSLVLGLLVLALLLCLNTVTISSSRTLFQMSRNGSAWRFLGRLNKHGVPANALRFDLVVNVALLLVVLVASRGRTTAVPISLLAAANVGYFIAVSVALLAAWKQARTAPRGHGAPRRVRPVLMRLAAVIAVVNLLLLATAGFAWGWLPLGTGVVILTAVVVLTTRGRKLRGSPLALGQDQRCMAWGSGLRTVTAAELASLHGPRRSLGEVAQP